MTFKGSQNINFAQVATPGGETGEPVPQVFSKAPLCDEFGRLLVVIDGVVSITGGGGGGGGDSFPIIPEQVGTPVANTWALLPDSTFTFPAVTVFETRIGFYTLVETEVTAPAGRQFIYNGELFEGPATATIPQGVYCEWSYLQSPFGDTTIWIPRGFSNEAPSGGGGGGGWLTFASGNDPLDGQWVLASGGSASFLPPATSTGAHVGIYVTKNNTGARVTSEDNSFQIDRNGFEIDEEAPLRPGSWYEWVSVDFGESFGWVPVGGSGTSARPPLEYPEPPYGDPVDPNQWVLTSTDSVVNFPNQPAHGDVFGIYADVAGSAIPATGHSLQAPNLSVTVTSPSSVALAAGTYYEWIFTAADSTWHPRQDMISGAGAALTTNPPTQISVTTAAVGVGTAAARDNHVHSVLTAAPSALTVGGTAGIGSSSSLPRADHVHAMPGLATVGTDGFFAGTDLVRLNQVAAVNAKASVRVVATANVTQQAAGGTTTIDSVAVIVGDRVLLTNQSSSSSNGLYLVSGSAWPRVQDADSNPENTAGAYVYVNEGTINAKTIWAQTTTGAISLGTTALTFVQIAGPRATVSTTRITAASNGGSNGGSASWAAIDHVHAPNAFDTGHNGYRISNDSANSLGVDNLISGTVYLVPYKSTRIALYDSTAAQFLYCDAGAALSIAVTGQTAGIPCDVFAVYTNATTATLELLAWTNATTRATGLTLVQGVWTKAAVPTRRYLGTILPVSATQYAHIAAPAGSGTSTCGIWNQDNQVVGMFQWKSNTDAWAITAANAWTQLNGQTAAKITYVHGQPISLSCEHTCNVAITAAATEAFLGIGLDTVTGIAGFRDMTTINGSQVPLRARIKQFAAAAGVRVFNAVGYATTTSANFTGQHGQSQGGLSAELLY
jgi:hypothetical protein